MKSRERNSSPCSQNSHYWVMAFSLTELCCTKTYAGTQRLERIYILLTYDIDNKVMMSGKSGSWRHVKASSAFNRRPRLKLGVVK